MTNLICRYLARKAAERLFADQIQYAYAALVIRQEIARRRWYAGTGPAPVFRRLPEETR